ncbi:MAG: C39 family peptidase [Patescibacteria group bacterium]
MKRYSLAATIFAILLMTGGYFFVQWVQEKTLEGPDAPEAVDLDELIPDDEPELEEKELPQVNPESSAPPPETLNIAMPFYTQAPYSNWDYPWQEACEEASVLLVANEFKNMNLNREQYNAELLRLVDWEMEIFGAYEHTDVDQTQKMMEENYGLTTKIVENPSFEDMQEILAKGHLILAPMAGKVLENPNFLNGGPDYHMIVIKGYDRTKNQVVTHDVGTRNGEDYVYTWDVIHAALHDFNATNPLLGAPRIIEVLPPQ